MHTFTELVPLPCEHELEQLGHRFGILLNLLLRVWVEDRKTCIDVPLIRVDAEGNVHLDVLNTTDVTRAVPRELVVREPCTAHAEESGMSNSLCVRCNAIMLLGGKIDVLGPEAGHNILHERKVSIRGAILDQHQWLPFRVYAWPVEGVHGDNADVFRKVFVKSLHLRGLA